MISGEEVPAGTIGEASSDLFCQQPGESSWWGAGKRLRERTSNFYPVSSERIPGGQQNKLNDVIHVLMGVIKKIL
jgi:hypothetical protein